MVLICSVTLTWGVPSCCSYTLAETSRIKLYVILKELGCLSGNIWLYVLLSTCIGDVKNLNILKMYIQIQ
jgi:hypothetical protein